MTRVAVLTKEKILKTSFEIVNEFGIDKVTIRSIANRLNTSTAPIYTQYRTMTELKNDLKNFVNSSLMLYLKKDYTSNSFLNIGIGLLTFAYTNKRIFQTYYLTQNSLATFIEDNFSVFINYMKKDILLSLLDEKRLESLIDDMWIYTFGLATIICTNKEILSLNEYIAKLNLTGEKLIKYHLFSSGNIENCISLIQQSLHTCPSK